MNPPLFTRPRAIDADGCVTLEGNEILGKDGDSFTLGRQIFMPRSIECPDGLAKDDPEMEADVNRVSKIHARLARQRLGLLVEDCGSINGSFVNGEHLSNPILIPWDKLPSAFIYLASPWFCIRFLLVETYVQAVKGVELSPLPLLPGAEVMVMFVGGWKYRLKARIIATSMPEAERGDMTIYPGAGSLPNGDRSAAFHSLAFPTMEQPEKAPKK